MKGKKEIVSLHLIIVTHSCDIVSMSWSWAATWEHVDMWKTNIARIRLLSQFCPSLLHPRPIPGAESSIFSCHSWLPSASIYLEISARHLEVFQAVQAWLTFNTVHFYSFWNFFSITRICFLIFPEVFLPHLPVFTNHPTFPILTVSNKG